MTLEEFNKMVAAAAQSAHMFIKGSIGEPERVRSVALRVDDDGVLSIVLYKERMKNRVLSDEAAAIRTALAAMRQLVEREPALQEKFDEFDGFFVHWDNITEALSGAGDDYQNWDESPMELITRLINERDELKRKLEAQPAPEVVAVAASESDETPVKKKR